MRFEICPRPDGSRLVGTCIWVIWGGQRPGVYGAMMFGGNREVHLIQGRQTCDGPASWFFTGRWAVGPASGGLIILHPVGRPHHRQSVFRSRSTRRPAHPPLSKKFILLPIHVDNGSKLYKTITLLLTLHIARNNNNNNNNNNKQTNNEQYVINNKSQPPTATSPPRSIVITISATRLVALLSSAAPPSVMKESSCFYPGRPSPGPDVKFRLQREENTYIFSCIIINHIPLPPSPDRSHQGPGFGSGFLSCQHLMYHQTGSALQMHAYSGPIPRVYYYMIVDHVCTVQNIGYELMFDTDPII